MLRGPISNSCHQNTSLIDYFLQGFTQPFSDQQPNRIDPQDVALHYQGKNHTFKDLHKISDKIASFFKNILKTERFSPNENGDLIIGICMAPSDKLIFLLFGILKLDATYMPINPQSPLDRISKIINLARPTLVVGDSLEVIQKFEKCFKGPILNIEKIWDMIQVHKKVEWASNTIFEKNPQIFGHGKKISNFFNNSHIENEYTEIGGKFKSECENQRQGGDKTAVILFTSGSTGEPKGVLLSHKTILNRLHWQWNVFPFGKKDQENCCLKTAITFVDAVPEIFGPLLQGHKLIIFIRRDITQPHALASKILESGITQLYLVPSLLKALLTIMEIVQERNEKSSSKVEEIRPLDSVRLWICSGEPLTRDLIVKFYEYFKESQGQGCRKLCNFYGSTEVMDVTFQVFESMNDVHNNLVPSITNSNLESSEQNQVPLGLPLWNSIIYVLTPDLQLVRDGEMGEIYAQGHHVGRGYIGAPSMNVGRYLKMPPNLMIADNEIDSSDWLYRTGDFGWIQKTPNGQRALFYAGRVDSQVKVRGHRVDLSEIQRVVQQLKEFVKESIVLCYHREEADQAIVAFIVPKDEIQSELEDKIEKYLKSKLFDYQLPVISIISEIPLLVHGKTDRQKLLKDFDQQQLNRMNFLDDLLTDVGNSQENGHVLTLLKSISKFTGKPIKNINLKDSFYNIGGTSLNSIAVISYLRTHNLHINIQDFVTAQSIGELAELMRPITNTINSMIFGEVQVDLAHCEGGRCDGVVVNGSIQSEYMDNEFIFEALNDSNKEETIKLFSTSFAQKGELEIYAPSDNYVEIDENIRMFWPLLIEAGYSFVARRSNDKKLIGICFNFDDYNKPVSLTIIRENVPDMVADCLIDLENQIRREKMLPVGLGKVLYTYAVATSEELTHAENVQVILSLEKENVRLAHKYKFQGIYTENTSPLTQQLAVEILGYEELMRIQANLYEAPDGTRPFILAPDDQIITINWKSMN